MPGMTQLAAAHPAISNVMAGAITVLDEDEKRQTSSFASGDEKAPLLPVAQDAVSLPSWACKMKQKGGRSRPQVIAHRGFRARYPENSMAAFMGAVKAGVHAIETDIHLTKDGVAVLSHDPTLKRCFGVNKKISDCDWKYLGTLKTLRAPHVPLARLKDLLEYITQENLQHVWLLLDIKVDDAADDMMRTISKTIKAVKPHPLRGWSNRIVLGFWTAPYLPLCVKYLPSFPVSYIGFSIPYARQFLKVPNICFNMLQKVMMGPYGRSFLQDIKRAGRPLFLWTVNDEDMMKWSIRQGVDGIITDDPEKLQAVLKRYDDEEMLQITWKSIFDCWRMNLLIPLIFTICAWKYGFEKIDKRWMTLDSKGRIPVRRALSDKAHISA